MQLLTKAKSLRDALRAMRPTKVAVAYVGAGWQEYVNADSLQEVIVSPTLGSNPYAIRELMTKAKVHFLDRLHSKFYLSKTQALIGSCNLSNNALSDGNLFETALLTDDASHRKQLSLLFDQYSAEANRLYPTEQKKLKKLDQLEVLHRRAILNGLIRSKKSPQLRPTDLADFRWHRGKRIHIAWWEEETTRFNRKKIEIQRPALKGRDFSDYFKQWIYFLETDDIQEGDWVIQWRCNEDQQPYKGCEIEWLRVDDVISQGGSSRTYTILAVEIGNVPKNQVPFVLTSKIKEGIRELLAEDRFGPLRPHGKKSWHLAPSDKLVPLFIRDLRKR